MARPERRTDIAVGGGGVTGLSPALARAEAGARVAVYDAGANAGSLHVQLQSRFLRLFPEQAPNVEASLPAHLAAVALWDDLDRRLGGGWQAGFDLANGTPEVLAKSVLGNVALAARLAPAIAGLRVIRAWAGLNTTADSKSIVGPLPATPRVVVAVPGDAGYTLGPLIGQLAAALALGHAPPHDPAPYAPPHDPAPYAPSRFA